jgi:hypothetical protein
MTAKYARPLLIALGVFAFSFLALEFWLKLRPDAAAVAAGIAAAGSFVGVLLGFIKTTLEIEKLKHENRKLRLEEASASRLVKSPSLEEIDRYGLRPRTFITDTHEDRF